MAARLNAVPFQLEAVRVVVILFSSTSWIQLFRSRWKQETERFLVRSGGEGQGNLSENDAIPRITGHGHTS